MIAGNGKSIDRAQDPPKQVCRNLIGRPRNFFNPYLFGGVNTFTVQVIVPSCQPMLDRYIAG